MSISYAITAGEPVNQQIYRFLRHDTVTCAIPPGSPLSGKEIALRFTVSRQPVREAFIKLTEAGLVQVLPQRGTFVRKISVRRVDAGRFIRETVETAVVRRAVLQITPASLLQLKHNLQQQLLAAAYHDTHEFRGWTMNFIS